MKQRSKSFIVGWIAVLLFTSLHAQTPQQPNIVFILADDLGWADLPSYGNAFNEAPHISRLAAAGMQFSQAYAAAPVCSPTRASIMSGQYPARVGVVDFITGHWRPYEKVVVPSNRTQYLPSDITTIAESLKAAGYTTGYFGKWHLGWEEQHHPLRQGFDEAHVANKFYGATFSPPAPEASGKRFSEAITDFGVQFMEKHRQEPFFLFIAHFDVHVQLDADMDLINKYLQKAKAKGYPSNAIYAAMIEHLDRSVGRLTSKLDELKLSDNTIVIFFSDNGGLIRRFDRIPLIDDSKKHIYEGDSLLYIASSNQPLRSEKGTLYEGGIREPLIVKWPGKVVAGSRTETMVSSVDFFPTLLEIAQAKPPENQILDGKSIVPVLTGKSKGAERTLFWHYPVYHHDVPASAVRQAHWKLIHNLEEDTYQLFDLKQDIGESVNLASKHPEKTKELANLLRQWRKEVKAELPKPNPAFDPARRQEWGKHPDR